MVLCGRRAPIKWDAGSGRNIKRGCFPILFKSVLKVQGMVLSDN